MGLTVQESSVYEQHGVGNGLVCAYCQVLNQKEIMSTIAMKSCLHTGQCTLKSNLVLLKG